MSLFKKKKPLSEEEASKRYRISMMSTTKKIIWILTLNGILWVWCSYVLAFLGRDQIAQELSSNVCTVIIGQTLGYLITKTIENVFKYNDGALFGTSHDGQFPTETDPSELDEDETETPPGSVG